jgi:hypothetical protein
MKVDQSSNVIGSFDGGFHMMAEGAYYILSISIYYHQSDDSHHQSPSTSRVLLWTLALSIFKKSAPNEKDQQEIHSRFV